MIRNAADHEISEIFGIDKNVQYTVPRYQREYAWGKKEWQYILDDLSINKKGYYLGSIICVSDVKDALGTISVELIDGQQRLTTVSIIYASLYKQLSRQNRVDNEFIAEKSNLKNRLIQKETKDSTKLVLSFQSNNFEDYKAILNDIGLYTGVGFVKPTNLGNRRLYKAYQFFNDTFSKYSYEDLLTFLKIVNQCILVKIEVDNDANAFMLFASLNNRGVPLSAMDLIKNKFFSQSKSFRIPIEIAYNQWLELIKNLPDSSIQERFLRQYYNAFRYKSEIKQQGHSRATRSTLTQIYERLIDNDVNYIFSQLTATSKIYGKFIDPENSILPSVEIKSGLLDLLHVQAATAYTLLLYLFSKYPDDSVLTENVIKFLSKYFLRRNITNYPETRDLDTIFMGLIDACETKKQLFTEFIINYLTQPDFYEKKEGFEEKLISNLYKENVDMVRYILCKLEEQHFTRENYKNLWEKEKNGKYKWTIEHIFPEGENIPPSWVNMIGGGNLQEAKRLQEQCVHKLGNLTLTVYNSTLSNSSFAEKRDRVDNSGNPVGYRNGLFLNLDLATKKSWTAQDIDERTNRLADDVKKLFEL